ncbi:MAG TPA: 23S rRNA (adenine(2503)-C(2))-methyltransferase RlmN [Kiritimatiellia bacterium]|nr:23S rRNA (adenine(2503)-C(2))-methyltransferase RlmN [Kiritimatiellia bacterium]
MISVYDLDGLEALVSRLGIPEPALRRFRIAYFKKGRSVDECLDAIPETARARFVAGVRLDQLELVERHDSKRDGASKLVFRTALNERVEAVLLRVASGRTSLCISSQIGCAADCAFCATGRMGLVRNLSTAEILDQIILAMRVLRAEERVLRNVVFMGMGEPFHNEKAVCDSLEVLRDVRGCNLSERHLLVSTAGVPKSMLRFVERFPKIRVALSLHSARQEVRERIMPIASHHSLKQWCNSLPELARHGNLMIEILLLQGVNDGPADLAALIDYLHGLPVHINLIQFNPFPGSGFEPVPRAAREAFGVALRKAGFKVTLRYSLGDDIAAACGQLAGV